MTCLTCLSISTGKKGGSKTEPTYSVHTTHPHRHLGQGSAGKSSGGGTILTMQQNLPGCLSLPESRGQAWRIGAGRGDTFQCFSFNNPMEDLVVISFSP